MIYGSVSVNTAASVDHTKIFWGDRTTACDASLRLFCAIGGLKMHKSTNVITNTIPATANRLANARLAVLRIFVTVFPNVSLAPLINVGGEVVTTDCVGGVNGARESAL